MIKNVDKVANQIRSVNIITRNVLKEDCRSANLRIQDWYTYGDNEYYEKVENTLKINKFVIEATQYGDILVLSNTDYLQGTNRSTICGQSIVFGVHQEYAEAQDKLTKQT